MSARTNYWTATRGSLSRRRMLAGTLGTGAGIAGLSLVGCGDDDSTSKTPTSVATSGGSTGGTSTTAASATATKVAAKPGGIRVISGTPAVFDTFDSDRTEFSTNLAIFNSMMDRILYWETFLGGAKLTGGIAEKWESPDPQTYVFKLRPNVFWHNKTPVNGRAAKADDIAFHIKRNQAAKLKDGSDDPNFKRKAAYSVVDTVTVSDASTVTVKLKRPAPRFLNLMAGVYEFVQAPEAVDAFEATYNKNFSADVLIGTGPYVFTELKTDGTYRRKKFDKAWSPAYLDGSVNLPLFADAAARQAGFEQKQIDTWNPPTAKVHDDAAARFKGSAYSVSAYTSVGIGGYYNGIGAPWNNPLLLGAMYRAFDRKQWIQQIHTGQGVVSGNALAYQTPFNLPEAELTKLPGFLPKFDDDLAEAKKMWAAGGGPALGTIEFDMADLYIQTYPDAPAALKAMIEKNLGNSVNVNKETYPNVLGSKLPKGYYGNGFPRMFFIHYIPQPTDPEPTDDEIQFFRSDSARAKYFGVNQPNGMKVDGLDDKLNKLDQETDIQKRAVLGQEVDKILVQNYGVGVLHGITSFNRTLYWNYLKSTVELEQSPISTIKSQDHLWWIDTADPSYQGRASTAGLLG